MWIVLVSYTVSSVGKSVSGATLDCVVDQSTGVQPASFLRLASLAQDTALLNHRTYGAGH
jgi:hypothetical protein